ncbi:MAG: hypothetical protein JNL36_07650 [Candidatus Kapabacteria bacterium]|nr:hypothetical protein [Candidatus Kapabacteria bacterium]
MSLANKRRQFYCSPSTASISAVHLTSSEKQVKSITEDFFVTDIRVVCYDASGMIPDDVILREQILINISQDNGSKVWFSEPIDSIVLNNLNKNGEFKGFLIPAKTQVVWTFSHSSVVTASILIAPITVQLSLVGYKIYDN